MRNYPQRSFKWVLDLFFPARCLGCGKYGRYICQACLAKIPINKEFRCIGCDSLSRMGRTCMECRDTNSVDALYICADYAKPLVSKLIQKLKYAFVSDCAKHLANLASLYISQLPNGIFEKYVIVPIPLTIQRYNWRGFNQAELIARKLGRKMNLKVNTGMLIRKKMVKPQVQIKNKKERFHNVSDSFLIKPRSRIPVSVLLIDDVCTTGATLNECSKALKSAGAKSVSALVIARG